MIRVVLALSWLACLLTSAAPAPSLLWSFESDDTTVTDALGSGLSGSAAGCGRAPGHVGQGLQLDGGSGFVVPHAERLRGPQGFTIECWVRSAVGPGPARNIVTKAGEFMLRVDPSAAGGTISFFVWCDAGGWEPRARGPRLEADRWYHLIASWDGTTVRLAVDNVRVHATRRGVCPPTDSPLSIGGPGDGIAGWEGVIDEFAVRDYPIGPRNLTRMALGLPEPDPDATDVRRSPRFSFVAGPEGWRALGNATLRRSDSAITLELPPNGGVAVVDKLACPAEDLAFCELRIRAESGERLILCVAGDTILTEIPIPLEADGRVRTLCVPCRSGTWEGTIQALALYGHGREPVVCSLESLSLREDNTALSDLRIRSLAPERRYCRTGQTMIVSCWVRNLGGRLIGSALLDLTATSGVRVTEPARQTIEELPYGKETELRWTVAAERPGDSWIELVLRRPEGTIVRRRCKVVVTDDPEGEAIAAHRSGLWQDSGYPRSMDFRHLNTNSIQFLQHNTALLVDLQRGRIEQALDFKRRYPDRLVLMQVNDERNGIWGSWHVVPREVATRDGLDFDPDIWPMPRFRGYWLLNAPVPLERDFAASARTCRVRVPDPSAFQGNYYGAMVTRDVMVYPLVDGEPDWANAEYAGVAEVDLDTGEIVLERWPEEHVGPWHGFSAGQAAFAASAGSIYRMPSHGTPWIRTWIPNLTPHCPRDPDTGLDACEWWARHFARLWHTRIAASEPHPDGLQFDGLHEGRSADADQDRTVDGCMFDGVNLWRAGRRRFLRLLREGGNGFRGLDNGLIVADSSACYDQRCPSLLNGFENEEFPSFQGTAYFPGALDMVLYWQREAASPVCTYLQGRFPCDTYLTDSWDRIVASGKFEHDRVARLGLGTACLANGIYTYRAGGAVDLNGIFYGGRVEFPWDEYHAGTEGVYNWLGRPLEPARRIPDPASTGELLPETGWDWRVRPGQAALEHARALTEDRGVEGTIAVKGQGTDAYGPEHAGMRVLLRSPVTDAALESGAEYWFSCRLQAEPSGADREPGMMTPIGVALVAGDAPGVVQWVQAGSEERELNLTLTAPDGGGPCRVCFLVGGYPGRVRVRDASLQSGCAERFTRRFENGLVLLNGSGREAFEFDLQALGYGDRVFRFLKGLQHPALNPGGPAPTRVRVGSHDARFLVLLDDEERAW